MTQDEIIKVLEREKRWMTTKEIKEALNRQQITTPLRKLVKYGEIDYKFTTVSEICYDRKRGKFERKTKKYLYKSQ